MRTPPPPATRAPRRSRPRGRVSCADDVASWPTSGRSRPVAARSAPRADRGRTVPCGASFPCRTLAEPAMPARPARTPAPAKRAGDARSVDLRAALLDHLRPLRRLRCDVAREVLGRAADRDSTLCDHLLARL